MIKRNIKKYIAILMIFCGLILNIHNYYVNYHKEISEKESIEVFFEKEENKNEEIKTLKENKEIINYIAILEIPRINLKKGLVDPNSSLNDVSQNIEILNPVSMPDKENSTFILASHSGNANISYFNRLDELDIGDDVYVYYKNIKYTYKITEYYQVDKTGTINLKTNDKDKQIVLTSCNRPNTRQLVYIGTLKDEKSY